MQYIMIDISPVPLNNPKELAGEHIVLRDISLEDVNDRYLSWLHNPDITQYLESRFEEQTLESIRKFVADRIARNDYRMFAVVLNENASHIGNVVLGPINWPHRRAEIGIMIGDPSQFGKGYATETINLLKAYAFQKLSLRKLIAWCYATNQGSLRAFQKCGFEIESTLKKHVLYNEEYIDFYQLAVFK